MYGYHGKVLWVDLSKKETKTVELKEEDLKNFIGGSGLAARLLYRFMTKDLDPLGPENPLAFITGPFTGSGVPSSGRHAVCAKSPLTNIWGEATSGGFFAVALKSTGFDGIIITGKSDKPVYLYVHDGSAEIRDASHLWGKGFYETRDTLIKEVGEKRARVAAIGQAGENLVKYAAVMNDHGRAAGRCGLGAVMGSKKLKAIVVHGDKRPEIKDPDRLKAEVKALEAAAISPAGLVSVAFTSLLNEFGTPAYTDISMYIGDGPARYFTRSVFPVDKVDGKALRERYSVFSVSCYGCPIGCGRLTKFGKFGIDEVDGPEYETVMSFGPLCWNFDLDTIVYANHLCNDFGLDTISTGMSIAFAMYLYEKGILTKDKAGLEIKWGDGETIVKLVQMIAKREGIGDLLAEGVKRIAEKLGVSQDEAAHVKGLEIPMHDPRAFAGQAVCYATSPRGACHLRADYWYIDMGIDVFEAKVSAGDRFECSEAKGAMAARWQNFRELYNALLLCQFSQINTPSQVARMLTAITGWNFDAKTVLTTGERIFNLKRAINVKLGVTRADDRLPRIAIEPLKEGATQGFSPDMETLLRGYYKERKWDWETGKPAREKLEELGLSDVAKDLWG